MFWYLPYWLEQEDQFKIEELKLGLQLELLRTALRDFEATLNLLDAAVMADEENESRLEELDKVFQLKKIFISFGFNEALQTIRRLHLRGFNMTTIMKDYKKLWDEYKERDIWKLIESNVTDTYVFAHNLILKDVEPLPGRRLAELSGDALDALVALEHAQQSNDPSEFTRAAMAALFKKVGRRAVIQNKIIEGAKALGLEDYHNALIFEVAARGGYPSFVKRLYKEGVFAIAKDVQGFRAWIKGEDLPFITDDELRIAAVLHQGRREQSRDLTQMLKPVPSTTLFDSSVGPGREIPVRHHSGPRPELEKAKDNKASIGEASSTVEGSISEIVSCADSGNDTESGDDLGVGFRRAVDGGNSEWLKENGEMGDRKDLLDDVIAKGADRHCLAYSTCWKVQKSVYLLHSLIKEKRE